MNKPLLALDKSMRTVDKDGRLHVAAGNPISKATVSPYMGREIPGYEDLRLDGDRVYYLLRDPTELAKAVETFNNLPILNKHVPVNAAAPSQELVVGSTGTDASFDDPYLTNSLVIWVQDSIDLIESEDQKELSAAYYYTADMTPGSYEGLKFDGVMRNIVGNHVALVREGRAGRDVVVGDSSHNLRVSGMINSRKALLVGGAVAALLMPMLAQDARLDLEKIVGDVTRDNFKTKKSAIVDRITKATKGKLAQDADLDGVMSLLDALEKVDDGEPDGDEVKPAIDADEGAADPMAQVMDFLKGKLSDEDLAQLTALLGGGAAVDADPGLEDDDDENKFDKGAMDAAIAAALANAEAISVAKEVVSPIIGKIAGKFDKASDVYKLALDAKSIDVTGVHESAYRVLVEQIQRPARTVIAQDASTRDDLAKDFPHANRLLTV